MVITVVNGSPRSNGATATILKEAQRYLAEKDGVQVQYVDLSKLEMRFCKGCLACYRTGKCAIADDEVEAIANKVKASDGIIIGSPTYGSNVSGLLKNFLDRAHFRRLARRADDMEARVSPAAKEVCRDPGNVERETNHLIL